MPAFLPNTRNVLVAPAFPLPYSRISIPFKSQFGWHILKVDDREEKDITDEMKRNKIAEFLHNRKYQEELDAWLQKIRDEAFVDIK